MFDVHAIRADFPALAQEVNGRPLVYLDNAATAQKPRAVLDRLAAYYARENANIHRGVHSLSQRATDAYEAARRRVAAFVGTEDEDEIVFTAGTTESINLVAGTWGRRNVGAGDEIVVTMLEHHSNIVPWQLLCEERGARLRVVPCDETGTLDLDAYRSLLSERTRIVAVGHVSNALGTVNPVAEMIAAAHDAGAVVLVDGAQAAPHGGVDVPALDADFYVFSGHKTFGPTGVGVLYGRASLLDAMPPWQGGGDMIDEVSFEGTTYAAPPHRFEAGTPHIAGGLGLATALDYLDGVGGAAIRAHERDLLAYATDRAAEIPGLRVVGTAADKVSVLSFVIDGTHPYDVGNLLDRRGIAVRTGHHCTQPLMRRLGLPGTVRASFAFYNTREEVDRLVDGLAAVRETLLRDARIPAPALEVPSDAPGETPDADRPETVEDRADRLAETFDALGELDLRREYLLELGKTLPPLDARYQQERYRVKGCQSTVWLVAEREDGRVRFRADSDALVTKGLVALLVRLLDGLPPQAVLTADLDAFMERIRMPQLISVNRKNGLAAMIRQMKLYALAFEKQAALHAE